MALLHILDLIGVFAFAVYGSHKAIVARFDLFGVLVCGALTAFGGGTIRELVLNSTPAYFHDYSLLWAAIFGTVAAVVLHRRFARLEKYLLVADAIGIAVFAYVGAYRADAGHLGLAAMVAFAVLTAAGGGVISDLVSGRRPEALYKDFYPLAAICLAVGYYIIRPAGEQLTPALILITMAFAIRLVSINHRVKLWQPYKRPKSKALLWLRRLATSNNA